MTTEIHSPAKVNLFLEVLARRDDGFHEIETLMCAVSLYDTLAVAPCESGEVRFTCRWASSATEAVLGAAPADDRNSVVQAIRLLQREANVSQGARVCLVKRIPSEAGLGGGSSDAAAALLAANRAWQVNWPHERLAGLAARLGSDTPFFCRDPQQNGATRGSWAALCRGRGEKIEAVEGIPRLHLVIVKPPAGLSTPAVYRLCRPAGANARPVAPLIEALRRSDLAALRQTLFNRLQEPARELLNWIGWLERQFENGGCLAHQMSGSGSSYYGLFTHGRRARSFAARLRARRCGEVLAVHSV